jgi:hypothetical protein
MPLAPAPQGAGSLATGQLREDRHYLNCSQQVQNMVLRASTHYYHLPDRQLKPDRRVIVIEDFAQHSCQSQKAGLVEIRDM